MVEEERGSRVVGEGWREGRKMTAGVRGGSFSDQMHLQVEVQVHQLQAQVQVQVVLAGRCKYEQHGRAG